MMNSSRTYVATAFVAAILAGFLFFLEATVPAIETINLKGRDLFFQLHHALFPLPPEADEILLVNLDDETLRKLEVRWPYPRSIYGELLERLQPFSPRAIGFDLIFSGNDRSLEGDLAFSEALKEAGNVVIATHRDFGGEVGPSNSIRKGAWEVGIVDKPRDQDHVIRKAFLSFSINKAQYPSWESALFQKAFSKNRRSFLKDSETVIDYRLRFSEFPKVSFWRLLEGSVLAKEVRNKIVLIGLTAESFHDIHETPLGLMPGLAVNANVLLMLMDQRFFSFAPRWAALALSFFSFWLTLLVALSSPFGAAFLIVFVLILTLLTVSFLLFLNQMILDLWLVALGMVLTLVVTSIFNEIRLFLIHLKLKRESARDLSTGFYTQKFLILKLELEFRRHPEISVIMFGFEKDFAFQVMAETVRSSVRKDELICRYGESEFCIVLPNASVQDAAKFSVKIRKLIQGRASVGIVSLTTVKAHGPAQLLKAAETVLARARSSGQNQVCVFDPERDRIA